MNAKLNEIYESIRQWSFQELIGPGDPEKIGMALFEFVTKHVPVHPNMRILDLGCGLGRLRSWSVERPIRRLPQR